MSKHNDLITGWMCVSIGKSARMKFIGQVKKCVWIWLSDLLCHKPTHRHRAEQRINKRWFSNYVRVGIRIYINNNNNSSRMNKHTVSANRIFVWLTHWCYSPLTCFICSGCDCFVFCSTGKLIYVFIIAAVAALLLAAVVIAVIVILVCKKGENRTFHCCFSVFGF